jgi:hypothetical protein
MDLPQPWHSRIKRLGRIALPAWLGSVVVAGTTDLAYKRYGGAPWISSVVVHFFQAVGLCAMGLFVLAIVYAPPENFQPGKALKIIGLVFGVVTLLLGLWGLWGAAANLLALLR